MDKTLFHLYNIRLKESNLIYIDLKRFKEINKKRFEIFGFKIVLPSLRRLTSVQKIKWKPLNFKIHIQQRLRA